MTDSDSSHDQLSRVFLDAISRWGGRCSLIVPVKSGVISVAYLDWLADFDPDYVVCFDELSATVRAQLDSRTNAISATCASGPNSAFGPSSGDDFLSSLSVLPTLVAELPAWAEAPALLTGLQHNDDCFLLDNFGLGHRAKGTLYIGTQYQGYANVLELAAPDGTHGPIRDGRKHSILLDEIDVLRRAADSAVLTLPYLATYKAPLRTWSTSDWGDQLNVVVGDTPDDRIAYWNARLIGRYWVPFSTNAIRVPPRRLESEEFCAALGAYISQRSSGFGGQPNVRIVSLSLASDEIAAVADRLRKSTYALVTSGPKAALDAVTPNGKSEPAGMRREEPFETCRGVEFDHLQLPAPAHARASESRRGTGGWLVDLEIDRTKNYSQYDNVVQSWRLPRKPQLAHLFAPDNDSRVDASHRLTVLCTAEQPTARLWLGDDWTVIRALLILDKAPYRRKSDFRYGLPNAASFFDVRVGDKGQALNGVLGLFGEFRQAMIYFGSSYWRKRFLALASPNRDGERLQRTTRFLKKRLARHGNAAHFESETEWEQLAREAIKVSYDIRLPKIDSTYEELRQAWAAHVENMKKARPDLAGKISQQDFDEAFDDQLVRLRDLGVFHQGHSWSCDLCGHQNWVDVGQVKAALTCAVCAEQRSLPIHFSWDFRLNEFLATSLREHDTYSLIFSLAHLWRRSRESFYFCAPFEGMRNPVANPMRFVSDVEIDLVCVIEGKIYLIEAKDNRFGPREQEKLCQRAEWMKPDGVIFVCVGGKKFEGRLTELEAKIRAMGMDFELITSDPAEWDSPLPWLTSA